MRICFVTQNIAPFRMQWLDELSKSAQITVYHLAEYDKTVNTKYISYIPKNIIVKENYRILFKKKHFNIRSIINEKPDIYILDGYGFWGQIELITILRIKKIPFIMSIDGGIIPNRENVIKRIIKQFCIHSPKAFFSTSDITDSFIKHYRKTNLILYRHYFSSLHDSDIRKISIEKKNEIKNRLGLSNKFLVLTVGRFIPIKGFDILLKAMRKTDPNVCMLFIGGKPTPEYDRMVEKLNPDAVKFIDFLNKEELVDYYLAADLFVTASRGDVWGLVIGEAMAVGLPVISSNHCIAGLSMIKDYKNGFIVQDDSYKTYAKYIELLRNNIELREKMSENNVILIKKYTIEESVKNDWINLKDFYRRFH